MNIIKLVAILFMLMVITGLTQVGGILFLIMLMLNKMINKRLHKGWMGIGLKISSFIIVYIIALFIIVPVVANTLGRVPLPLFEKNGVKPGNRLTVLLFRNYVSPPLRDAVFTVAEKMSKDFPGTVVNYLDANFPFMDKFPLLPHLSHHDGKKLDLSFAYTNKESGKITNELPSFIGYGICEEPNGNEVNTASICDEKGYWQYSFLKRIIPQGNRDEFLFDEGRTKRLVNLFASEKAIGKIFIEPHLKTRLGLTSKKIRFHGCQAVRHDDHIHVQLLR